MATQMLFEGCITSLMPLLIISVVSAGSFLLNKVRPWLRFPPILLLPLCFIWQHDLASAIVLLIPCVFTILIIALKRFSPEPGQVRSAIVRLAAMIFILSGAIFFGAYEFLSSISYFSYLFLFIICAISILRIARADAKMLSDYRFVLINTGSVIAGVAVLFALGLPQVLGVARSFITNIVIPAGAFVLNIIWIAVRFVFVDVIWTAISFVIGLAARLFPASENGAVDYPEYVDPVVPAPGNPGLSVTEAPQLPDFVMQMLLVVLVAMLITFGVFFVRKLSNRLNRSTRPSNGLSEIRSTAEPIRKEVQTGGKQGVFVPGNPRRAVRHYYRRFLRLCADRGVPPEVGDTSVEVCAKNEVRFPGRDMIRLRELYIKARYSEHAIGGSESREAGELVQRLRDHRL